jgi:hypothetical protein
MSLTNLPQQKSAQLILLTILLSIALIVLGRRLSRTS